MKKLGYEDEILRHLEILSQELKTIKARMISIESWLAALSRGKDLSKSHAFAKDITSLSQRINPTLEIENGYDCQ